MTRPALAVILNALVVATIAMGQARAESDKVQVFILAGQSNMEGKASLETLSRQIKAERTKKQFAHLHDGEGNFVARDDVFITFFDRHGPLEVDYGSRGRFGPELGFGWTVGNALDQPVLIIKVAWGGRSLFRDFRSPSALQPNHQQLAKDLEAARRKSPDATLDDIRKSYGKDYRDMLEEIARVQENYQDLFPQLKGKELQLAGFVWFQGWNDMVRDEYSQAYTNNMVHFIQDIRRDLDAPKLPVVIGQLGVDGPYTGEDAANDKRERFKARQAAAAELPEFQGNVAVVKTDQYWDPAAAEAFKTWQDDIENWRNYGDDRPYHYLGSPKIIYEIGQAFGESVLELSSNTSHQSG
ncbi:sialate O-acetylesterase [Aeoliella sp. ICT_H6.2]|uniref:Sialate O-acetylesterase n=1 Tax=Aeoliella straminimaris TaxID=2954799 RepID=A0A9X2FC90_9BACT|nr:sialate O-acetylesterase [Aeoliella straminimaris]MCO6046295.1 sialate O-acetylesterase [Aeoliella straminimaris]